MAAPLLLTLLRPLLPTLLLLLGLLPALLATVVRLPQAEPTDLLDFEAGVTGDWQVKGIHLVNTSDRHDTMARLLPAGRGVVAVPETTMTGDPWATLSRRLQLHAHMQVSVDFSIFVSGYTSTASAGLMDESPDFQLRWGPVGEEGGLLTTLADLQPGEGWGRYRAQVVTGNVSAEHLLEVRAARGRGVLALDNVAVAAVELVGPEYVREPVVTTTTTTTTTTIENGNVITTDPISNGQTGNTSDIHPTTASNNTVNNEQVPNVSNTTTESNTVEENASTPACSNSTGPGCQEQAPVLGPKDTSAVYGYTGEVVLISLTVLFAVLFLGMVAEYFRLKTRFGDYQLGGTAQPAGRPPEYENPAYQVTMNYRDRD